MTTATLTYQIAGLGMAIDIPDDIAPRLDALRPFQAPDLPACQCICHVAVKRGHCPLAAPYGTRLEEYVSDLGVVAAYETAPDCYVVTVDDAGGSKALIEANADFSQCTVWISTATALHTLMSALRIAYSQAITLHGALALHASCVTVDGRAYLFAGKSGSGKSTHSRMWLQAFAGASLLNDDCVIVRVLPDGTAVAWGSPWSGKTPCYINAGAPVAAIEKIIKSDSNRLVRHSGVEAFNAVLPGCSAMRQRGPFFAAMCDTLAQATSEAAVGTLYCLPTPQAALYNMNSLTNPQ